MTSHVFKAIVLVLMLTGHVRAEIYRIEPETNIKELCKKVTAGDTIVMKNGVWRDLELKFDLPAGTEESPITIEAQGLPVEQQLVRQRRAASRCTACRTFRFCVGRKQATIRGRTRKSIREL